MSGVKYDMGKAPMDLIDSHAMEQLAHVLGYGAQKYAKHNWRHGLEYSRLVAAVMRHITAFNRGEDLDPESGLSHSAHAMCCMMFLNWMEQNRPDMDDRWKDHLTTRGNNERNRQNERLPKAPARKSLAAKHPIKQVRKKQVRRV
jgi:hypothetical protein